MGPSWHSDRRQDLLAPAVRAYALFLSLLACLWSAPGRAAALPPSWQTVRDDVYLQEVGKKISSAEPLWAVGALGEQVFVGSTNGLFTLDKEHLTEVAAVRQPIARLVSTHGELWAAGAQGLFRLRGNAWRRVSTEPVADLTAHNGQVIVAIGRKLFLVQEDSLTPYSKRGMPFRYHSGHFAL